MLCHYLHWDFDTSNLFIFEQGQWINFELFLDWICTLATHYFDVHSICFWIRNYSFYATGELVELSVITFLPISEFSYFVMRFLN